LKNGFLFKLITLLTVFSMLVSLSACSKKDTNTSGENVKSTIISEETVENEDGSSRLQ